MSATNRSDSRIKNDEYHTPGWCVTRFLEKATFLAEQQATNWLEPCAGGCNIIKAVNSFGYLPMWHTHDLAQKHYSDLAHNSTSWSIGNFLETKPIEYKYQVVMTNPPYSEAMGFLTHTLYYKPRYVIMLLRTNFLSTEIRSDFMRAQTPDLYVLPNRPSFAKSGTDNSEYAWFVWDTEKAKGTPGQVIVLDSTSKEERKKQ